MATPEADLIEAIIETTDEICALLEAPRGLTHPRHQEHIGPAIDAVKDVMASYFKRQGKAILAAVEPHIESVIAQFREATPAGQRFASTLLPSSLSPLRFAVTAAEISEFDLAITDAITGAAKVLAAELASGETIAPNFAGRYLSENSLTKLTGGFADTTLDRLRGAIAGAWDAGGSYDQVVGAIKGTMADFSEARAELVAQTEVADAYNAGRDSLARTMGFDEKGWETESGNPCDECEDNEGQGWIDIDEDFQSGDDAPTAHPRCMCVLNFRTSSE